MECQVTCRPRICDFYAPLVHAKRVGWEWKTLLASWICVAVVFGVWYGWTLILCQAIEFVMN